MASPNPEWIKALSEEDFQFVHRFILASGSLKALTSEYGVSYPTVRARLDRLIAKIKAASDSGPSDLFQRHVRVLVADGALSPATARSLLEVYQRTLVPGNGPAGAFVEAGLSADENSKEGGDERELE